jgi:hypothetical protein
MAAAVGPMIVLVNSTPDRIPADVIAEELEQAQRAQEKLDEKEPADLRVNVNAV